MSLFSRLFARFPKKHVSAYGALYSAVVAALARTGVYVGGTAGYPRVEVHSITESERLDKEGELRSLNLTVESISNKSMGEAVGMNDYNLDALTGADLDAGEQWDVIGVIPGQLQDLTETTETNTILYRIIQQFTVYVSLVKTDTEPVTPTETNDTNGTSETTES